MFTLPDQSVAEVWPHVEGVVAVEPRKLKLTVIGQVPHIIEDDGTVGRLFMLAGVNRVVGNRCVNRNQPRLEGSAVVPDAVHRQFMSAEVEHLRDVALILLAMLQSIEVAITKGDFGPNPGPVRRIGWAPTSNQVCVTT